MSSQIHRVLDNVSRDALILPENFLEKFEGKSKEQNAGIIGANSSKIHLFSYSSHA